jgi:hypothetical protein
VSSSSIEGKGTKDFHADFLVLGEGFGFKDFEKFGSFARFDFVSAHFDEHGKRGAHASGVFNSATLSNCL